MCMGLPAEEGLCSVLSIINYVIYSRCHPSSSWYICAVCTLILTSSSHPVCTWLWSWTAQRRQETTPCATPCQCRASCSSHQLRPPGTAGQTGQEREQQRMAISPEIYDLAAVWWHQLTAISLEIYDLAAVWWHQLTAISLQISDLVAVWWQ